MGNNWTAGGDKSESLIVFEQMIMNHDDGDDQIMEITVQIVNGIEEEEKMQRKRKFSCNYDRDHTSVCVGCLINYGILGEIKSDFCN